MELGVHLVPNGVWQTPISRCPRHEENHCDSGRALRHQISRRWQPVSVGRAQALLAARSSVASHHSRCACIGCVLHLQVVPKCVMVLLLAMVCHVHVTAELLAHPFLNPTVVLQQQQQLLAQHLSSATASAPPAPASASAPTVQANVQKKQVQSLLEQIALLTGQKQLVSEAVLEVCLLLRPCILSTPLTCSSHGNCAGWSLTVIVVNVAPRVHVRSKYVSNSKMAKKST